MKVNTTPTTPKSALPVGQAVLANYMNRMFFFSILGILAFFGLACGLGSLHTPASVPNTSALSISLATRL